jgi:hypothetical protein
MKTTIIGTKKGEIDNLNIWGMKMHEKFRAEV